MPNTLKVLVVDDDEGMLFLLSQMLRLNGYESIPVSRVDQAIQVLAHEPIDVVLADIAMPGQSGLELLRWIREQPLQCEVILLTGSPAIDSAIQALRAGAADYLTKPVSQDVLMEALSRVTERLQLARARQQALTMLEAGLRQFTAPGTRLPPPAEPGPGPGPILSQAGQKQYRIGPVLLDLERFVIEVNGQPIDATPSEIEILHYLCRHSNRVVSAHEIIRSIRGYRVEPNQAPELLRPHISNLRRKLQAVEAEADVVRTVRGVGYMLKDASGATEN